MKRLLALLIAAILAAGVLSVYAEDASTVPAAQGTVSDQQKDVKAVKKVKKHHKHGKKKAKKVKKTDTEAVAPDAAPTVK